MAFMRPSNSLEGTILGSICRQEMDGVLYTVDGFSRCYHSCRLCPMCQLQAMPLSVLSRFLLYLEPVACHTTLVLLYCALAVFLRIVALREQHAVVSACFLVFADTARLVCASARIRVGDLAGVMTDLDFGRCFASRFKVTDKI
jgi:hypothetical protein